MSEQHAHLPRVSKEVREREGKCESEHIYKRLLKDTDGRETEEQTAWRVVVMQSQSHKSPMRDWKCCGLSTTLTE